MSELFIPKSVSVISEANVADTLTAIITAMEAHGWTHEGAISGEANSALFTSRTINNQSERTVEGDLAVIGFRYSGSGDQWLKSSGLYKNDTDDDIVDRTSEKALEIALGDSAEPLIITSDGILEALDRVSFLNLEHRFQFNNSDGSDTMTDDVLTENGTVTYPAGPSGFGKEVETGTGSLDKTSGIDSTYAPTDWSVSFWLENKAAYHPIARWAQNADWATGNEWQIFTSGADLYFVASGSNKIRTIGTNDRFHIVFTQTGGTLKIYIDGAKSGGDESITNWSSIVAFGLMRDENPATQDHTIDDFQIWSRVLTTDEISILANGDEDVLTLEPSATVMYSKNTTEHVGTEKYSKVEAGIFPRQKINAFRTTLNTAATASDTSLDLVDILPGDYDGGPSTEFYLYNKDTGTKEVITVTAYNNGDDPTVVAIGASYPIGSYIGDVKIPYACTSASDIGSDLEFQTDPTTMKQDNDNLFEGTPIELIDSGECIGYVPGVKCHGDVVGDLQQNTLGKYPVSHKNLDGETRKLIIPADDASDYIYSVTKEV